MHYWIDGYNLLFFQYGHHEKLEELRAQLIEDFSHHVDLLGLHATLVFDSMYHPGERTRSHRGCLEIVFTDEGETADEYILSEVEKSDVHHTTVVSSDKLLSWRVRRLGAFTESVPTFLSWLKRRYKNKLHSPPSDPTAPLPPVKAKKQHPPSPSSKADSQECLAYYQEIFQKKSLSEPAIPFLKKEPQRPKMKRRKKPQKEEVLPAQSPFDRWLNIFEEKMQHEQDIE